MVVSMGLGLTLGFQKKLHMKEALKMGSDMERGSGAEEKLNIMEGMLKGSRKDMESSTTRMGISTRETLWKIRERDMEKCSGQIRASTKGNGKKGLKMGRGRCTRQEGISSVAFLRTICWCKQCHRSTKSKWKYQTFIFRICLEISPNLKD